jgi:dCTP diphosphatase
MDDTTTIGELRTAVAQFVSARDWDQFHTPKNLAISIAIEAAEIMEHFQWSSLEQAAALVTDDDARAEVADELADVLIYCLSFANAAQIDIAAAIRAKLDRNEGRFPVDKVNGRLGARPSPYA